MRRILCCALGGLLLLGMFGLSACKKDGPSRAEYSIRGEFFPEENKIAAQMTVSVPNNSETVFTSLSFELWANAYREGAQYPPVSKTYAPAAYYAGESWGGIEILSVGGAKGYEVCGEDENILSVALEEELYPGERAEIEISFETLLPQMDHRLGVGEHTVNLTHFYPALCAVGEGGFLEYVYSPYGDPFVSECADYELSLTLPAGYRIASNGTSIVHTEGDKQVLELNASGVRDIAVVLGKQMELLSDSAGKVPIEYWYIEDGAPQETMKAAKDALSYFSRTFGEYGYSRYVLVQTDFPYGGMEYSGLAMIAEDLPKEDVAAVGAHETAHQWWYGMVGSDQFVHAWQDEGLAEFSAALFLGAYPEYGGSYEETVARSVSAYRAFYSLNEQLEKNNTAMERPLTQYAGEYEYRNLAYDKGVILFDRLRATVGDRKFFSGLKNYVSEHSGRIASPEDLMGCFHRAGADVEGLFRSFLDGTCVI